RGYCSDIPEAGRTQVAACGPESGWPGGAALPSRIPLPDPVVHLRIVTPIIGHRHIQQIGRDAGNDLAQLQLGQPAPGDGRRAVGQPERAAGDPAGAAGVTAVVNRSNDAGRNAVGPEATPDTCGQCLLGAPATAIAADTLRRRAVALVVLL